MEVWKDIKGYEGLYQVSNYGNIKNIKRCKAVKPVLNSKGYELVGLYKNRKRTNFNVHRLVASAFIANPENFPCVNHKDENKQNNSVKNLEWCSYSHNTNYGKRNKKVSIANSKIVYQYTANGFYLRSWASITAAERFYNLSHGKISMCCNGKRKTAGGYVWRYEKEAQ